MRNSETNFVAVAGALLQRHARIYETLRHEITNADMHFHHIDGAENIWARDWMPLQVPDGFVKFYYGYGEDNPGFTTLRVRDRDWEWVDKLVSRKRNIPLRMSTIRLDGGNVVRHEDEIVMTDIIYKHNPEFSRASLRRRLEHTLAGRITVVPREPGDDIGHTDGICHFMDDGELIVQNFHKTYATKLWKALKGFKEVRGFPNAYHGMQKLSLSQFRRRYPFADTFNPGYGYYINLLRVGQLVFLPQFTGQGHHNDCAWFCAKDAFPGCEIINVECSDLSMEGGLLNCVTMNYKI